MKKLEKRLTIAPAYDRRNADPKKNYGVHGVTMRWELIGEKGAISFVLFTNWQLPHVAKEQIGADFPFQSTKTFSPITVHALYAPLPADIGYHSYKKMYKGQSAMDCDLLKNAKCYYDGSSLNADKYFEILVSKGGDALWEALEDYYKNIFI